MSRGFTVIPAVMKLIEPASTITDSPAARVKLTFPRSGLPMIVCSMPHCLRQLSLLPARSERLWLLPGGIDSGKRPRMPANVSRRPFQPGMIGGWMPPPSSSAC